MNLTENETKTKLESVDWEKVHQEILPWALPTFDEEKCFDLVLHAAKTWVPEDFAEGCSVGAVEELRVDGLFKGFADVTVVRSPEYMKIIDWKTTGSVDAAWKTAHAKGWQALWYGRLWWQEAQAAGLPLIVEFRGIERGGGRTRVVPVPFTEDSLGRAEALIKLVVGLREHGQLRADGSECYAYGRPCEYLKKRCDAEGDDFTNEEYVTITTAPISPTSAKRIFACPRKNFLYQLDKLRGKTEEAKFTAGVNEKATFGNAFHSGIGEVYRQLGERNAST